MKDKKLHLIFTIFSLIAFCTISLLFTGCYFTDLLTRADTMQEEFRDIDRLNQEKAQQATEEEKQTEVEQATPSEESATDEKAEQPVSDELITYSGIVNEAEVILIVDFKTTEVTGSINLGGDDYINASITGKINMGTLEIKTKYSGTGRLESEGEDYPVSGIINGKITNDLSTFNGFIQSDFADEGVEFTLNK